jgi:cytochrome b
MTNPVTAGRLGGVATPSGAALTLFSRLLIWALFAAYIAFYLAGARYLWLTAGACYALAVLVVMRVVWAFVGARHGRLAEALHSPRRLLVTARQNLRRLAWPFPSRLPTARAMVVAIIGLLVYVSATGMLMTASPLSGSHTLRAAHDAGVYGLVGLVFLGLLWAVLEGVAEGESLVRRTFERGGRC